MKKSYEIFICEVCGSNSIQSVLSLGNHPLCDDLVTIGENRICDEFPIEIMYCENCKTAHQRYQVPKLKLFSRNYHYRSRFTFDVLDGMRDLVDKVGRHFTKGLSGARVVDIGCNDGSLLEIFRKKGAATCGVEPTDAARDAALRGDLIFNQYFNEDVAKEILHDFGQPDIITFTNVFAHIEDLKNLLKSLKIIMSENTVLVIENHYIGSIISGRQFDTFYHEHPRTYSLTSFKYIAKELDSALVLAEFPKRYGGNIRVFISQNGLNLREKDDAIRQVFENEKTFGMEISKMQEVVERWRFLMSSKLLSLAKEYGPLPAKAFPGRAAILVKLLNLDNNIIRCAYEKSGSMKVGHYIPGTRIPIFDDEQLDVTKEKSPVLINFAWHISSEIRAYMRDNLYFGEIIDIFDPVDFV